MRARRAVAVAAMVLLSLGSIAGSSEAADIKVVSTNVMKWALPEIVSGFEQATGHKVSVEYGLSSELKLRLLDGDHPDVALLTAPIIEDLVRQERVVAESQTGIAHCGLALVAHAGAEKPDISSPEAFKNALLKARSVAFSRSGQSGLHFSRVLEWLGISDTIKSKIKPASGNAATMVAKGEAEFGIQHIPDIRHVDGVDMVGPLPESLQDVTNFSAGVESSSQQASAAQAFIRYLSSPAAVQALKANGFVVGPQPVGS